MQKVIRPPITALMAILILLGTLWFGLNPPPAPYNEIILCPSDAIDEISNPDGTTLCYFNDHEPEVIFP